MTVAVNRFYRSIEDVSSQNQKALIELFVYFLTVEAGQEAATPAQVADCFRACDLAVPGNVSARLAEGLRGRPGKFIKTSGGYKLQRHMREGLSRKLGAEQVVTQTSAALRNIEHRMPSGAGKDFLKEAIDCFEVGAGRATIVMVWILAMDHLFAYILTHKLTEFNAALSMNPDKNIKVKTVIHRDDFTEIKESKFIEICRSAKIISNDVRKILEQKLDSRNSCAHPSGITINRTKVIDFVEDIVDNVILKYRI